MSEHAALKVRAPRVRRPRPPPVLRSGHRHGALAARAAGPESRAVLQPKLRVGRADDPLEREAEAQAARIVAMPAPDLAPAPCAGGASAPGQPARRAPAQDQPDLDTLETVPPLPADLEEPTVAPEEDVNPTALDAGDLAELESGSPEDTGGAAPAPEAPPPPEGPAEAGKAQPARAGDGARAAAVGPEGGPAPPDVSARVARPGPGRPLPPSVRAFMELRFGVDLADVRLHDGAEDRRAAARIGARAFTLREHIWLGHGEAAHDRRLIAHELAHVIQQTGRRDAPAARAPAGGGRAVPVIRRLFDLAAEAESYARQIPGYTLLTVILGKSPLTDERVPRTAENLIGGFLGLLPGGTVLFDRLQESRALEQAFEWVSSRLADLDITWTRVSGLIERVWEIFPTLSPLREIRAIFAPLVEDILTFAGEIKDKVLEFIVRGALRLAGPLGERVWGVIQNAGDTLSLILSDPLTFAKNLVLGVLKGYGQFALNILEHLKRGLLGWLFGALQGADLQLPERLDFKGLISIVLQILGLTYASFRKKLVKRLGASGEKMVSFLERSVEVVKLLATEGFLGIWQKMLSLIDDFKTIVIGGIRDLVITSIVRAGLSWLAGLSNPVGAVVRVVLAIYDLIVVFLERIDQILEVANAVFAAIGTMARGNIQQAADAVEAAIGRNVPVVISFLAGLIGLTGISTKIRNVIKKLRKPIDQALEKLLGFVVKKAKKLFSKLIAKLNSKRKLPSANFTIGKTQHRIFAQKKGRKAEVYIASRKPKPIDDVRAVNRLEMKKIKDAKAKGKAAQLSGETDEADSTTEAKIKPLDLDSQKKNMKHPLEALDAANEAAARELEAAGVNTEKFPEINTEVEGALFRARDPRDASVEGQVDTHTELKKLTTPKLREGTEKLKSDYYDVDHVIEKRFPKAILENLRVLNVSARQNGQAPAIIRSSERGSRTEDGRGRAPATAAAGASDKGRPFGQIGPKATYKTIDEDAGEFPGIVLFHKLHKRKTSIRHKDEIERAGREANPHDYLKHKLTEQLDEELAALSEAYANDTSAPEAVRNKIDGAKTALIERNKEIYQLGELAEGVGRREPAAENGMAASEDAFKPRPSEKGKPDFTLYEGVGKAHGEQPKTFGKYLEHDHIVEQAYGEAGRDFFANQERIRELVKERIKSPPPPAKISERLGKIEVFGGTGFQAYNEDTGYAVALHRPIAKLVTRAVPKTPTAAKIREEMVKDVDSEAIEPLARFVENPWHKRNPKGISPDEVDLELEPLRDHIRSKFRDRVALHSEAVANEYAKEIRQVELINPQNPQKAKQAMLQITRAVKKSLVEAKTETDKLFDKGA